MDWTPPGYSVEAGQFLRELQTQAAGRGVAVLEPPPGFNVRWLVVYVPNGMARIFYDLIIHELPKGAVLGMQEAGRMVAHYVAAELDSFLPTFTPQPAPLRLTDDGMRPDYLMDERLTVSAQVVDVLGRRVLLAEVRADLLDAGPKGLDAERRRVKSKRSHRLRKGPHDA